MLRVIWWGVLGIVLVGRASAVAAGTVGVVVTGEAAMQPTLVAQLEAWLHSHGHKVMPRSLDPAATTRLVDCLVVDDSSCARQVVETKSRTDSVVFANTTRERTTVTLSVYWIVKGRPGVGGRRGCEECTPEAIRGAADELLASLAPAVTVATGRLKLHSQPDGAIVMLDGAKIGVTPIERDIAVGPHELALVDGGTRVGERRIQIVEGATIEVTMPVVYPRGGARHRPLLPPSKVAPIALFATAGLAFTASGYMFYLGQKGGPEDQLVYPYANATGFALVGIGAAAISTGVWLWMQAKQESTPIAVIGGSSGYIGWQGRF